MHKPSNQETAIHRGAMDFFPDFFLFKNFDGKPWLDRFKRPLTPNICGTFHLAFTNTDLSQIIKINAKTLYILGEIYTYKDRNILSTKGSSKWIESDLVSNKFYFKDLNGHYFGILVDELSEEVTVFSNKLGTLHGYYCENVGISTSIEVLANHISNVTINWEAVQHFVKYGFYPEDRTQYKQINLVPPATAITFDKNFKLKNRKEYWCWHYNPDSRRRFTDSLDAYHDCLVDIMSQLSHSNAPLAVPISGGLDSRETFALCSSNSRDHLRSFSYGLYPGSPEIAIGRKLAELRSTQHRPHVVRNYFFTRLVDIARAIECAQCLDFTRQIDITDWLIAEGANRVIASHWGDVWNDATLKLRNYSQTDLDRYIDNAFAKPGYQVLFELFSWKDELSFSFHNAFSEFMSRASGDQSFAMKMLKTLTWSHRWTLGGIRAYQFGAFPRLPYYDDRILEFFLSTPEDHVVNRRLQIEHLKKWHPDLAKVTWEEYGVNLYILPFFNNRNIIYRVVNKFRSLLHGPHPIRNWEIFFLDIGAREKIEALLDSDQGIKKLLDRFYTNPNRELGYAISVLLTLKTCKILQ